MQGIYAITCTPTGEQYIGKAVHIYRRWSEHEHLIRAGHHHSRKLAEAWAAYGPTSFTWSVLEVVDDASALLRVEREYLRRLRPAFNIVGLKPRRRHLAECRAERTAADLAAEAAGGIWITEAMVKYRHSRNWFNNRIRDSVFDTIPWPGTTKVYLLQEQVETYLREHPEESVEGKTEPGAAA